MSAFGKCDMMYSILIWHYSHSHSPPFFCAPVNLKNWNCLVIKRVWVTKQNYIFFVVLSIFRHLHDVLMKNKHTLVFIRCIILIDSYFVCVVYFTVSLFRLLLFVIGVCCVYVPVYSHFSVYITFFLMSWCVWCVCAVSMW